MLLIVARDHDVLILQMILRGAGSLELINGYGSHLVAAALRWVGDCGRAIVEAAHLLHKRCSGFS